MKKCEKCEKKFSKEDFSKLKYKQSFIGHFADEMDPFNELTICPECVEAEAKKENTASDKKKMIPNKAVNLGKKAKASKK